MDKLRKKVIYFSYSSIPSFTANSIAVMNFCSELSRKCDLTIVCTKNKNNSLGQYDKFYGIDKINLILVPKFFLKYYYIFYKIYALILFLKIKPDIIYSRDLVISYTLSNFGIPNIFEIHQIDQNGNNYYCKTFKKKLYKIQFKESLKKIVCISDGLKKECIDFGIDSNKLIVSPSGVRKDFFISNKKEYKKEILYLGSLQKGKGIDNIINLAHSLNDYKFYIIGGLANEISNLPKNVIHESWIEPSKILNYVKSIDYAIMLFDDQKYKFYSPLKLFEYLAMGKIVVASNITVINEIIIDGYNGFLVPPKDIKTIIDKIKAIENDNDLKKKIIRNAQNTAKKYTWENKTNFIIETINEIVG